MDLSPDSSPSPHALNYYKPVKNSKNFTSQSHVHNWIIDFLTDRTQSVVLLGKLSKEQTRRSQALYQSCVQFTPQILRR